MVRNGFRVVWDLGYYIDTEDADYALDLYSGLCKLPAFFGDMRRPQFFLIRDGEPDFSRRRNAPRGGRSSCSSGG